MKSARDYRSTYASAHRPRMSDAPALVEIRERELCCVKCRTQRKEVFAFGRWNPAECTTCNPAEASPQEAERVGGYVGLDLLNVLARAGFNMHKLKGATLTSFRREHDGHAPERAEEWIEIIRDTKGMPFAERPWFYFFGDGATVVDDRFGRRINPGRVGNQKTWLATAITRALVADGTIAAGRLRFATSEEIILATEATFRSGSEDSEARLIGLYAEPELLIVDEFMLRPPSAHVARLFDEILRRREGKATGFTSNVAPGVLDEFDPALVRLTDRIMGNCGDGARFVVKFSGPSIRRQIARGVA